MPSLAGARDVDRLASLRGELRGRIAASPLVDQEEFTQALEVEYRDMWTRHCDASTKAEHSQ